MRTPSTLGFPTNNEWCDSEGYRLFSRWCRNKQPWAVNKHDQALDTWNTLQNINNHTDPWSIKIPCTPREGGNTRSQTTAADYFRLRANQLSSQQVLQALEPHWKRAEISPWLWDFYCRNLRHRHWLWHRLKLCDPLELCVHCQCCDPLILRQLCDSCPNHCSLVEECEKRASKRHAMDQNCAGNMTSTGRSFVTNTKIGRNSSKQQQSLRIAQKKS